MSDLKSSLTSQPRAKWSIVIATTASGALWLLLRPPPQIPRVSGAQSELAFFWYMVSAFPILGLLLADSLGLYGSKGVDARVVELAIQLVIIISISSLRIRFRIPISGHMLLFTFFLARTWFARQDLSGRWIEVAMGLALFLATSYIKLLIWNDVASWITGVVIAVALVVVPDFLVRSYEARGPQSS